MRRAFCSILRATALASILNVVIASAQASQSASLSVELRPEVLGQSTTIEFGFKITVHGRQLPSPLTRIALRYPANLGLVTSGLGLTTCNQTTLEVEGPDACPPNALMGKGTATVGIPFGPIVIRETGYITIWMAPVGEGHVTLIFNAEAFTPVFDELVLYSRLLAAPSPYGGELNTAIPPLETLPGAANGSILTMHATLGPKGITYYEGKNGQRIRYTPAGIILPRSCPQSGFPFSATFSYEDATKTTTQTRVPCPGRRERARPHHRGRRPRSVPAAARRAVVPRSSSSR